MAEGKDNWLKIDPDLYSILKQVSTSRNKTQTEYIERGLKLVFDLEKIPQLTIFILPVMYFFAGCFLLIFTILFMDFLPLSYYTLVVTVAMFIIVISIMIFYSMKKIWKVKNATK